MAEISVVVVKAFDLYSDVLGDFCKTTTQLKSTRDLSLDIFNI